MLFALGVGAAVAQLPVAAVTGAPFSADQMQTSPYKAEPYVIGHFYRDSSGRTRTEQALITAGWAINIVDPVRGVAWSLDVESKIAHRKPATAKALGIPPNIVEQLGSLTISTGNGYSSWLANIRHEEPAAALFQVPDDYRVVVDGN